METTIKKIVDELGLPIYTADPRNFCGQWNQALGLALREAGYLARMLWVRKLLEGPHEQHAVGEDGLVYHCFVLVDKIAIDITARQFYAQAPFILLTSLTQVLTTWSTYK